MIYHCTIVKEGDEYIAQFPDMTNIVTCGFSSQAYQRLENPRKSNPTIKTLERIAQVFGCELNVQIG